MPQRLDADTYIEVALLGNLAHPELSMSANDFFLAERFKMSEMAFCMQKNKFKLCVYIRQKKRLEKLYHKFQVAQLKGLSFDWKLLGRRDWRDKWMIDYKIMPLGAKLTLVPVWRLDEYETRKRKRIPIILEPRGDFGSGTHETTQLMVRMIESLEGKFKDVLDLGTGTGILSVAAWRMGAKTLLGLDHDKTAPQTAARNMSLNGCASAKFLVTDLTKWTHRKQYDLVMANLFTNLLLAQKLKICARVKKGQYLIISGVATGHDQEFRAGFKHSEFRCLRSFKKGKWCGYLFKRRG